MVWLEHALQENPYISGAIACVVTFVLLSVAHRRPVRTEHNLMVCLFLWMGAAVKVMRLWPPTRVQSEILAGTILACFLFGYLQSRVALITFDTTAHEFFFERSVLRNALNALFTGVVFALLLLSPNNFGDCAAWVVMGAWITGGALGQWRRIVRAGGA